MNLEAAHRLQSDPKIINDDDLRDEAEEREDEYRERLEKALKAALNPQHFTWHHGEELECTERNCGERDRNKFLTKLISETFQSTPTIREATIQHYETGSKKSKVKGARLRAIDQMLGDQPFAVDGTSQEESMLRGLLRPNKMFLKVQSKNNKVYGEVEPPDVSSTAHKAWEILKDHFLEKQNTLRRQCDVSGAARTLYRAPFGMSAGAVEFLVGAFVAYHKDGFTLFRQRNNETLQLCADNLAKAIATPEQYTLCFLAVTPDEQAYLKQLDQFLITKLELIRQSGTHGPWDDVANKFLVFYEKTT